MDTEPRVERKIKAIGRQFGGSFWLIFCVLLSQSSDANCKKSRDLSEPLLGRKLGRIVDWTHDGFWMTIGVQTLLVNYPVGPQTDGHFCDGLALMGRTNQVQRLCAELKRIANGSLDSAEQRRNSVEQAALLISEAVGDGVFDDPVFAELRHRFRWASSPDAKLYEKRHLTAFRDSIRYLERLVAYPDFFSDRYLKHHLARGEISSEYVSDNLLALVELLSTPGPGDPTPPAKTEYELEPPTVDVDTFTVRFKGRECELGCGNEFLFFERLNRHPGHYVSTTTLGQEVWNDKFVEKATIQKTASNLRTKLRTAGFVGVEIDGRTNAGHYALKLSRQ